MELHFQPRTVSSAIATVEGIGALVDPPHTYSEEFGVRQVILFYFLNDVSKKEDEVLIFMKQNPFTHKKKKRKERMMMMRRMVVVSKRNCFIYISREYTYWIVIITSEVHVTEQVIVVKCFVPKSTRRIGCDFTFHPTSVQSPLQLVDHIVSEKSYTVASKPSIIEQHARVGVGPPYFIGSRRGSRNCPTWQRNLCVCVRVLLLCVCVCLLKMCVISF